MQCLRCGCCCFYGVVVINPSSVKEDLNLLNLTDDDLLFLDGSEKCPHLSWDNNENAVCAIHHYSWFKETPCGKHTQVESDLSDVCRLGKFMRKNKNLWRKKTLQEDV